MSEATASQSAEPAITTGEPLVQVRDLVKHFPISKGVILTKQIGAVQAVDRASFDVLKGETLGIVGESVSRKSTTARLLMRLMSPTSGSIGFEHDLHSFASRRSPE